MNVERGQFEPEETPGEAAGWDRRTEAVFKNARADPRYARLYKPVDAEDLAHARADVAAGRCVPHEKVAEWLKTRGTPDFKPMPREWLE